MLPDGIAGAKTLRALSVSNKVGAASADSSDNINDLINFIGGSCARAATFAKTQALPQFPSRPVSGQHISQNGLQFIFTHEAMLGVTNHLHWPGGASGVTLGAGYDMKLRTSAAITRDMVAIGLDATVAKEIGEGGKLDRC